MGAGLSETVGRTSVDTVYVRTYYVKVNITLSVDTQLVERARRVAREQGTSLNALIRRYIETLAGPQDPAQVASALEALWREEPGHSGGRPLRRQDAYEDRL
jgi:hypothetical protein